MMLCRFQNAFPIELWIQDLGNIRVGAAGYKQVEFGIETWFLPRFGSDTEM